MITPAQRAEIRRLYYGEHWKMGTIAVQLGLHRETVRAAVEYETGGVRRGVCRPSALDPFLPLIRNTLAQYPRLRAIAHQAILAGHSALFTTAADLLLDLNGQETARALERRLRHYTRPALLVID